MPTPNHLGLGIAEADVLGARIGIGNGDALSIAVAVGDEVGVAVGDEVGTR